MLVAFFVADPPSRNPDLNDQKIYQIKVCQSLTRPGNACYWCGLIITMTATDVKRQNNEYEKTRSQVSDVHLFTSRELIYLPVILLLYKKITIDKIKFHVTLWK